MNWRMNASSGIRLAAQGLAMAYGDDEPDYSLAMIKEPNPEYKPQ